MEQILDGRGTQWSSLLVPCVQELAKESVNIVPSRYLRPDQDPPLLSYSNACPGIPIVDFGSLLSEDSMDSELKKLDSACKEWGFFQLINHGVNSLLVEKVKSEIQDFFNLPMEEKKKFWQKPADVEGFGQAFVVSEEQKLDWGDLFFLTTLPAYLRKPHLFPKLPLPFRVTLEDYTAEMQKLALKILDFIAKALKLKGDEMKEIFEDGMQSLRMNYYPPCPQPESVIGLTPHSDAVGLTVLLQVNDVEGLQIKNDGMWVSVRPLPNAFIVNIGDILEIVSNGKYRSIEHRAVVNSGKERLSIAAFHNPKIDSEIGPAPSLITPQTPAIFKTIKTAEYLKGLFARELHGKSYLDVMRVKNNGNS